LTSRSSRHDLPDQRKGRGRGRPRHTTAHKTWHR
jgi:hypothetical protein